MNNTKKISIIIPIFNEEENISELYKRLKQVKDEQFQSFDYEFIFVDDGSKDNSFSLLEKFNKNDKNIKIIQLSRNFGQHIAIKAGLDFASGDYTAIIDADLQDQPEDLGKLYKKLQEGYNIVIGIRENRQDSFLKKTCSNLFFKTMNFLSNIKMIENQAMLRIFDKKVLKVLQEIKELNQNNGSFLAWIGFKTGSIHISHHKRQKGKTKYNIYKSIKFATDTILNFSNKPLIYISLLGIFISIGSVLFAFYIIYEKIFNKIGLSGWASLIAATSFFGGMNLFAIGIIGLYIGRIYQQSLNRPLYNVINKIE